MKKIYILIICFALIGCGTKKETTTEKQAEPAVKTETKEVVEEKKEEPKEEEYIAEKGKSIEFPSKDGKNDFSFTATERKVKQSNDYIEYVNKERLDEGERYYHLVLKIKSLSKEPLQLDSEMFQVETEDGTLYKNTMDYADIDNISTMEDGYSVGPIPGGTSKEIKLNYKLKGEVKSIDFVYGDKILGRLMLK